MKAWLLAALLVMPPLPQAVDDAVAQVAQAKALMRAGPVEQPAARALFERAAGQGSGPAAYYLGLMFKNGMGGPQDSVAALRWLELAAQRQVAPAMFLAANMRLSGDASIRDEEKARYWLDAACDAEYPEALLQKSIALGEGTMGYARNAQQAALYMKMAEHAMGHRSPEP